MPHVHLPRLYSTIENRISSPASTMQYGSQNDHSAGSNSGYAVPSMTIGEDVCTHTMARITNTLATIVAIASADGFHAGRPVREREPDGAWPNKGPRDRSCPSGPSPLDIGGATLMLRVRDAHARDEGRTRDGPRTGD